MERSQMDEPRSSIPNGYVAIHPGNFAIVKEDFHNREVVKLWVKERKLKDGFIRKYRKQNGKWECCGCVSMHGKKKRNSYGSGAYYPHLGTVKVAKYDEGANTLHVAKAHSISSCKPFKISSTDFANHFPTYEREPRVRRLSAAANITSAPIVFQMPNLSLTPPVNDQLATAAPSYYSATHDLLFSAFTNILNSPVSQAFRPILYSTNPTINPMRSDASATIPLSRIESLNATVTQQPPPTPTSTISAPSVAATVTHPANVIQRSVDDPNIITEGAGNYEEEENVQHNLLERSIVSTPDDPITELIQVKTEAYVSMEANESNPNNDSLGANENVIDEEIVEIKEDLESFEPASNKNLKSACKKLSLTSYSRGDALGVWAKILIEAVKPFSNSIKSGDKGNGFECLSLLLTGSHGNHFELCNKLNMKLESDEEMKARYDLSKRHEMSLKFCEEHLVLLAHWLSCRIGVYEHGVLQKYGNWNSLRQTNDLVILMEKEGDLYAPVLNL